MRSFDSISRKTSALPQTPWPQLAITTPTPKAPRRRLQLHPRHRTRLMVVGGLVSLIAIGIMLRPDPHEVSADTSQSINANDSNGSTTANPVTFAQVPALEAQSVPTVLDQPTANSIDQPETTSAAEPTNTELPTVRILNGGPTEGAANAMRDTLASAGYNVISVGDAQFDYIATTIYYTEGNKAAASQVAKTMGDSSLTTTENIIASPAQILVVLGGSNE